MGLTQENKMMKEKEAKAEFQQTIKKIHDDIREERKKEIAFHEKERYEKEKKEKAKERKKHIENEKKRIHNKKESKKALIEKIRLKWKNDYDKEIELKKKKQKSKRKKYYEKKIEFKKKKKKK